MRGLAAICLILASCRSNPPPAKAPLPQVDRFAASYPPLRQGRFAILADFTDPRHGELVEWRQGLATFPPRHVAPPNGWAAERAHWFEVTANGDGVTLSDARSAGAIMKRDWRDYDLLLLNLVSLKPGRFACVRLVGPSGVVQPPDNGSKVPLQEGRNLVRIDLADWASRIPLRDVRAVRVDIEGVTGPEVFGLSDVVLTADREKLWGDADGRPGSLFVERVAGQFRAGASGQFELIFRGSGIVAWFDLSVDPFRAENLVGDSGWGPAASLSAGETAEEAVSTMWREASCRWVELNSIRVVMECECAAAASPDGRGSLRSRFVLHPDGMLFVDVRPCRGRVDDAIGWDFALRKRSAPWRCTDLDSRDTGGNSVATFDCAADRASFRVATRPAITCQNPPDGLETGMNAWRMTPVVGSGSWENKSLFLVFAFQPTESTKASQLSLSPLLRSDPSFAIEAGGIIGSENAAPGRLDPAEGGFVVRPEAGRVGLRLLPVPGGQPPFNVIVEMEPNQVGWVYINQRLHSAVDRDARGRLLFRVPGMLPPNSVIEVLLRQGG